MVVGHLPQQTPTWVSKGFPLINPPQSPSARQGIYRNLGRTPQRGLQDLGCATQRWTFTLGIPGTGQVPRGFCLARCIRNLKYRQSRVSARLVTPSFCNRNIAQSHLHLPIQDQQENKHRICKSTQISPF